MPGPILPFVTEGSYPARDFVPRRVSGPSGNNVYAATPVHLVSVGLLSAPSVSQKTFWYLIVEFPWLQVA